MDFSALKKNKQRFLYLYDILNVTNSHTHTHTHTHTHAHTTYTHTHTHLLLSYLRPKVPSLAAYRFLLSVN
jgi:hypothetical protein